MMTIIYTQLINVFKDIPNIKIYYRRKMCKNLNILMHLQYIKS